MPEETNRYLAHLEDAEAIVENVVDTWGEDGNPAQSIMNHLAAGWQCEKGDDLIDQVRDKGLKIKPEFESAEDVVSSAVTGQLDEPKVEAGNWRGDAYRR